jgi:hypothetical protein
MAGGFGDGNDIKITVSLDTTDAVAGLEALKGSLEKTLEAGTKQFEDLAKASAKINAAEVARIKAASAEKVAQLKLEKAAIDERTQADAKAQAAIEAAAQKRADLAKRELTEIKNRAAERLNAQKIELNSQKIQLDSTTRYLAELQKEGKTFRETEATKRAEIQKTIALIKQQTQEIKRQSAGAGAGGSGGLLAGFGSGKQFSGLINSLGLINSSTLRTIVSVGKFGGAIGVVAAAGYGYVKAVNAMTEASNKLAAEAFKIEGLRTGFENLQRTVGNDPGVSINALRKATQGLVTDTELYQRANQAVLLGVPTETFNAAAAAAVKLGRAMGIDASQGLESLSLGLGRQSRLYLDNLGIIVSAEEAYKRFAAANNLVASQLSDGEKKAAFYAEALRKIYERAAELPDAIDSVAVSYKKLEVVQGNIQQKSTEAFNNSVELAGAYRRLTKATEDSGEASKRFAILFSEIAAPFVRAKASLVDFITSLKEGALFLASFVLPTTEAEQFAAAFERLAAAQREGAALRYFGQYAKAAEVEAEGFKKAADSIEVLVQKEAAATRSTEAYAKAVESLKAQKAALGDTDSKAAKFLDQQIAQAEALARVSESQSSALQRNISEQRQALQERVALAEQAARAEEESISQQQQFNEFLVRNFAKQLDGIFNLPLEKLVVQKFVSDDALRELEDAKNALNVFEGTLNQARANAEKPITLRIDTTEIDAAANRLPELFNKILQSASRDVGVFTIPGVDSSSLDNALGQISTIEERFRVGKISAQDYVAALREATTELGNLVGEGRIATLSAQLQELQNVVDSGGTLTTEQTQSYSDLSRALDAARESASASAQATEELGVAIEYARKQGQKAAGEFQRDQKKISSAVEKESKKAANEYKKFVRDLNRTFNQAIPKDLQKKLTDLFNTGKIGSKEFIEELDKLGEEAIKTGVDIEALKKEIEALNKLKIENPLRDIKVDSTTESNIRDIESQLGDVFNIKKLFGGDTSGGFFGYDLSGIEIAGEQELASTLQSSLSSALQIASDGVTREDAPQIGRVIGTVVGAAIGAYFGSPEAGAMIGGFVGEIAGTILQSFGADKPGTKERKKIDAYFAELFDGKRLGIVIDSSLRPTIAAVSESVSEANDGLIRDTDATFRRLSDIVFEGFTPFAGYVQFGGEAFRNYFDTLSTDIQASFNGVGLALGTLAGIAPEQARLVGVALANNIGGSLQNLQVLVQATGESFDDLAQAIVNGFLDAQLTIEETYNSLVQLQNLYGEGIPGAIGDYQQAIDNLTTSLRDNAPGRYAIDSLRDIGAEGREAGASFQQVISALGATFGFTSQQMQLFFEALRIAGITTLDQLAKASDAQLITILENYRRIKEENAQTIDELAKVPQTDYQKPRTPSGTSKADEAKRKAEEEARRAEDERKRQLESAYRLTVESQRYAIILEKIAKGELTQVEGGKEILKLRNEILRATAKVAKLEAEYQAELAKGGNANRKRLAELGQELDKATNRLDNFKEKAKNTKDATAQLDLAAVIPLIRSMNSLGVVTKQAGVEVDKNVSILVKGFLQGRLSIGELNDEIKKTKDLLGPGIPGAIGAVTDAFQNLIDAGEQGGQFSVDAFVDIFAEFREKFQKEGSELRKAEREQLVANVNAAREAFDKAIGPDAVDKARKSLDTAKKALEDFYAIQPKPDLADLRSELEKSFSATQVDKFFQALDESGLRTFDDFEKAGADSVVGILGKLKELGFSFGTTSKEIKDINDNLQEQEKKANNGLDPLAKAIELVKQFNAGASTLPPVFNDTTDALDNLNKPLAQLASGFDNIIEKLSRLSGNSFENEVVFNVRTVGDTTSKNLVEIIYGDGSSTGGDSGSNPGGDGSIREQIQRLRKELNRLVKSGKGSTPRADKLRDRIRKLRGELR